MSVILSSSLLDNERIQTSKVVVIVYIKYVNMFLLNHFMNQTREFAHYQYYYYYIHRRLRLMHSREQKRNHSNTKSFSIEDFFENVIFKKNEIIHKANFSLSEIRIRNCFLTWNSFEHELFASWCVSHQANWLLHSCLIASKFSQWLFDQIVWTCWDSMILWSEISCELVALQKLF